MVIGLMFVALLGACGDTEEPEAFPAACNLPSPEAGADASTVPSEFLVIDGTVVRETMTQDGLAVTALNIPAGVATAYDAYLEALDGPPYELVNSENEGFEAEIYLHNSETGDFVAIQLRNPGCEEAVSAFVTAGRVGDPTGKSSK